MGVLAAVGCADVDRTDLFGGKPADWENLARHENTAVVGQAGAVIVAGNAAITIPRGALADDVEITVEPVQAGYPEAPGLESEQLFAFLPHGTQFLEPVTITIPHAHGENPNLALYTSEPNVPWAVVPGATFNGVHATAQVNHFSFFFSSPVALEQLNPDGQGGAGGSSAGTEGQGGSSNGGSSNGGSSNGGSSNGGSAGQGGSSGDGPDRTVNYLDVSPWHGYLYSSQKDNATITREGMCASGQVEAGYNNFSLWGWNLNQTQDAESSTWTPDRPQLHYEIQSQGEPLRLIISGENNASWCLPVTAPSGTVNLTDFRTECWGSSGTAYDGTAPLTGVQVMVPGQGSVATPFDFCVVDISPAGTTTPVGGGGNGGGGGAGGSSGEGGAAGSVGEGGAAGSAGEGGAGGSSGAAGSAGEGGAGGSSGTAGSTGEGGASGSAGEGGSAGDAGQGGAGGGAAGGSGTGGSGSGGPDTTVGYLDVPPWHGHLYTAVDTGGLTTITREGVCAFGEVATGYGSWAIWGWNINQTEQGDDGTWQPDTTQLRYAIESQGEPLRLAIHDQSYNSWCLPVTEPSGVVDLTDFRKDCWGSEGEHYDGTTPLMGVQVFVPGAGSSTTPFDFCVLELAPIGSTEPGGGTGGSGGAGGSSGEGGAGGSSGEGGSAGEAGTGGSAGAGGEGPDTTVHYLDIGDWYGNLYAQQAGLASIERAGMCASGIVPADSTWGSYAHWAWNIAQEMSQEAGEWTPDASGIFYDLSGANPQHMRLVINDGNESYCRTLSSSTDVVSLSSFSTQCWINGGTFYDGSSPLRAVQVQVTGSDTEDRPFDFCVNELAPANLP